MPSTPKVNERQVGGSHYRSRIQHWDMVAANRLGYFEGKISGYVTRWRKKNGTQDLEKASHFLEKLIDLAGQGYCLPTEPVAFTVAARALPLVDMAEYAKENGLDEREELICFLCAHWAGHVHKLREMAVHLKALLDSAGPELRRG